MSDPAAKPTPPPRLVSLDAYRGFIMVLMASSGLGFARVFRSMETASAVAGTVGMSATPGGNLAALGWLVPDRGEVVPVSALWGFLGYQFDHVAWTGCALWDLIQPSFMFMVGVAVPYSLASRRAKGDSYGVSLFHAAWRALLLVLLAVFLSSPQTWGPGVPTPTGPTTNWVFTNVLAQIGLGYVFVFLLASRGFAAQSAALLSVLFGTIAIFALWPIEGADFAGHWRINRNAGHFIDVWLLNLFPRVEPFTRNSGGYQTLNFLPSVATMILGLMAGEVLRSPRSQGRKFALLVLASVACFLAGLAMSAAGVPIVKRIWTPSWALFSAGWTFAMLAAFYGVIDIAGFKAWAFPLVVVGMNSIAMYVMSQQLRGWVRRNFYTHLGREWFAWEYGPIVETVGILAVLWAICWWMYRRGVFLRL